MQARTLALLLMAALLTACTTKAAVLTTATPASAENTNPSPYGLWVLQGIQGSAIEVKRGSYIILSEGQCYLYAGCNHIYLPLSLAGDTLTISDGPSTLMACSADQGYERQFTSLLRTAHRFAVDGNRLVLHTTAGVFLTFSRQNPSDHLPGQTFIVRGITFNGGVRHSDSAPLQTLTFMPNGTLSGKAGCNTYRGTYKIEGTLLYIQQLITTSRTCPNKEKMEYESYFLQHLQKSPLTIDDSPSSVTLREADGKIVMVLEEGE